MKLKLNTFLVLLILSSFCLSVISCKKKKKEEEAPAEIVTSLNLVLDAPKGKQDVIVLYSDITGINNKIATDPINLEANTLYTGTITLEDESVTPKKNVSTDYNITYRVTGADVTVTANGINPQVQTRAASSAANANLEVTLAKNGKTSTVKFPLVVKP